MKISFTVPGDPVPKGRPRFRMATGTTYTPTKTKRYERLVRESWAAQSGKKFDEEPIRLVVTAVFRIPKSYSKKLKQYLPGRAHVKAPDIDNVVKAVLDGCNGYAFEDDRFIAEIIARKEYGVIPRTMVSLETIEK